MVRPPHPSLRPFLKNIWVAWHQRAQPLFRFNEHALPDGHMHVVIRLSNKPIRIIDSENPTGRNYGFGIIGGARASFYIREVSGPTHALGATLLPGAAQALFGVSATEFADRHTALDDVWSGQLDALRDRLLQLPQPHLQLELFEMYLMARSPSVKGLHPAVAAALSEIHSLDDIRSMVSRSGFSHRRFVELFGDAVGLTPKRFARVLRFQRMLKLLTLRPETSWANLAADAGYSDQPHFNREFKEFAGLTPEDYKRVAPISPGHVLVKSTRESKDRRR